MNRSSIYVQVARFFQLIPIRFFRFIEWPIVKFYGTKKKNIPPIIIFALPRGGSTVTYQSICHATKLNYLSNIWHLFYQLPLIGGLISSKITKRYFSSFKSHHGFVNGLDGPAEGIKFWQWWIGCGLSDPDTINILSEKYKKRSRYLSEALSTLSVFHDTPFATAFVGHALAPDLVHEIFPEAILIRIKRSPMLNALSILHSMRKLEKEWFSVKPSQCFGLENSSEHRRVASQVYWLNKRLDNAYCSSSMLTINYEDLCENPEKQLKRIKEWCSERKLILEQRHILPQYFNMKNIDHYSKKDVILLKKEFNILESKNGPLN